MPLILIGIGLLAGVFSGMLGIGGGVIIVPLLALTSMPILTATGTSLGALMLPAGIFGAWVYYKNGHLDVRTAVLVAVGLSVGAFIGARIAQTIPPTVLRRGFALLMVAIAVKMWIGDATVPVVN